MSVCRIITRLISLNSLESTFQPASFESLTDGNACKIMIRTLKDPESGMKFKVEMIKYVQNVGPGETVDSINADFAKKLEDIPGFVQLKANDVPFNPYDKSIQINLPKVLSGGNSDETSVGKILQENKSTDSFKISVIKNDNPTAKRKNRQLNDCQYAFKNKKSRLSCTANNLENSGLQSNSKSLKFLKTKYGYYLGQKIKNSAWGSKNKLSSTNQWKTSSPEHPTSSYVEANEYVDSRRKMNVKLPNSKKGHNSTCKPKNSLKKTAAKSRDRNIEDETDTSLDLIDCGDLVIRALIPEDALQGAPKISLSDPSPCLNPEHPDEEDSSKYSLYPLSKLLMSLKKYFVNGECLICGFIPAESDFSPSDEHMKTHISSNSLLFRFCCSCCDERFATPKDLYKHALSRDNSYKYVCTVCNLNFKRRHYWMRHNANSWKNHV